MLFDFFEDAYYITLNSRPEREKGVLERFAKLGIRAKRFGADKPTDPGRYETCGKRGCAESHFSIIEEAKKLGLKNVFIFEDDVLFPEYFSFRMKLVIEQLKALPRWDMFYTYGRCDGGRTIGGPYFELARVSFVMRTHAYAINGHMFDPILDLRHDNNLPIDTLYRYRVHPDRMIFNASCLTRADNRQSDVTDVAYYKKSRARLRQMRRKSRRTNQTVQISNGAIQW